jgi:hypothetical protein
MRVAFQSLADDLVTTDSNLAWDVFVRELALGQTWIASVDASGVPGDLASQAPALSGDGRLIAFESYAALVPGDTNNTGDVFVHDLGPLAPTPYCTSSTTSNGCNASIGASGVPSVGAASGFTITVAQMDGQRSGLVFYGTSGAQALPWAAGSTSFLCVKLPTQRTPAQSTGGHVLMCDGSLALDFFAFAAANPGALGQPFTPGATIHAQGWVRDPAAPKTTNLSNALAFSLVP